MDYLDAQTSVRYIRLFQKYYNDNMRTVHSTRSQPAFAEHFIGTFFNIKKICWMHGSNLGNNGQNGFNPYCLPITTKLDHAATGLTPKEASEQDNELDVYVNQKLKAKQSPYILCHLSRGQGPHIHQETVF